MQTDTPPATRPRPLTTRQLADEFGVAPSTIREWERAGRIGPATRTAGGHRRWDAAAVRSQLTRIPEDVAVTEPTYLPPVVAAIITSARGVVAGRRLDGKPPWSFPSGEVAAGESFADAAVRKAREEAGIAVRATGRELGRRLHPQTERDIIYVPCEPTGDLTVSTVNADELADPQWLDLDQLDRLLPTVYAPVRAYLGETIGPGE